MITLIITITAILSWIGIGNTVLILQSPDMDNIVQLGWRVIAWPYYLVKGIVSKLNESKYEK